MSAGRLTTGPVSEHMSFLPLAIRSDTDEIVPSNYEDPSLALHVKQDVALTGRNTTGPPSRAAPW